jgi:hypothetical protein
LSSGKKSPLFSPSRGQPDDLLGLSVSDLHANGNEASSDVPRLRLSKSGTPKASKRRNSRSGAQSKSPLQCDQDIEPQQKLFIEMAKMLADIQKASSDRKASFGVNETLKPPLAQHLGSGWIRLHLYYSSFSEGIYKSVF